MEQNLFNLAHPSVSFGCRWGGSAALDGLFSFWSFGSGMGGTDVGNEFLVTMLLVILLHGIESASNRWRRGVEYPCALRTSPALKIIGFGPDEFSAHG